MDTGLVTDQGIAPLYAPFMSKYISRALFVSTSIRDFIDSPRRFVTTACITEYSAGEPAFCRSFTDGSKCLANFSSNSSSEKFN
jgi:hypothetical protein